MGTIEARKNHTLLYYTYKLAKDRGITLPKLVVVGRPGWKADNIYDIMTSDPDINEQLIILQDICDNELSWLYENCLFSIYPSFYEGWGLPIAESIARKVPCICSNTSSMPEIAGNLVDYFSPLSADECLAAIVRLLDKEQLRKAKERVALYKPTSWDQSFATVNAIIGDL